MTDLELLDFRIKFWCECASQHLASYGEKRTEKFVNRWVEIVETPESNAVKSAELADLKLADFDKRIVSNFFEQQALPASQDKDV